jgi:threonine/homoserine/homoserine lactone efflux protein
MTKTGMLLAMILAVDVVWLLVGSALTRASSRPGVHRAINVAFAVLLVASVALALVL